MLITDIIPQKKKKDRVNIFIDGKFAFSLDLEILTKENLAINQEISQEKIKKLIKEGEFIKLYDKAVRFLSLRPRSEKEIMDYLRKKQAGEEEISMVVAKLKEIGLIDDFEFANWWVEQRETFRPRSKMAIKIELLKKGIDKEVIDEVLSGIRPEKEIEMARYLATKALKRYKNLPRVKVQQKLSNFLVQRSFNWEIVKKVVDEILGKE